MKTKTILALAFAGLFTVTASAALTGVTINGTALNDAAGSSGAGWTYTPPTLTLSGVGPFTLSGNNTAGKVRVVVQTGVTCDVTLSNLTLKAMSDGAGAFALGNNAKVSLFLAGENTLDSGYGRAGLEVPAGASLSITNVPGDDAGALTATGGDCAAGIGGGNEGHGGTVAISGGTVTATGTWGGAGIGGGDNGTGAAVAISGGIVFAQGEYGAGIGGGYNGDGGTVNISGGTVFAQGNQGGQDIGKGVDGTDAGPNTFTGGSIRLTAGDVSLQPSNNTAQVGCAMVPGFDPGAPVAFTNRGNLPLYYGTDDIYADEGGAIHLWLPDGTYTFTANGRECTVTIQGGVGATGVTVNGEEAAFGPADSATAGWSFDAATRTVWLFGAGPFTLSGVNEMGGVSFAVPDNIANTVTLSNLTIRVPADDQCAFALGQNANVSLLLAGANTLASGSNRAGIEVAAGRTLSITNAPGDDAGSLTVTGGDGGAGIGGDYDGNGGTLTISGGTVAATGGDGAAGIGGGDGGDGGTVTIHGGTVTATGGQYGTGIGGGDFGNGGTVTINGGSVTAIGDSHSAGIGGGDNGAGGTVTINGGSVTATSDNYGAGIGGGNKGAGGAVTIHGGTVFAQGGTGGADIGPGRNSANAGANTFTGGSICLAGSSVVPDPTNGSVPVFCAVVSGFEPRALVEITITGVAYGVHDIVADESGSIYLWLPNGTYDVTANGEARTVKIENGVGPTGVTVNGVDVAFAGPPGSGWVYDGTARTLTLSGAGPFLLSGANVMGGVCVVVPEGVTNTITLSNLTLRATGDGQCAFALETNACVSLLLAGTNELASGRNRAGLEAAEERTLSITNAPGDDAGALTVTGGYGAAGIGGGYNGNGGTVTVNGGAVTAAGGYAGAGIGGGYNYSNIPNADTDSGGTVTVNGGAVTATGGYASAGIGGGAFGGGGTITINSGAVTAMGGFDGAGIGGGYERQGSTATITGGEIFATGGDYAPGIGGGFIYNSTNSTAGWGGTVAISGGRVMATGGKYAAGIGGGSGWTGEGGDGADLTVSGGTVFATGGADGGPGVGSGVGNSKNGGTPPHVSGTCTFTGGSIRILGGYAADDPTDNNTELVWCVTVTNLTPNAEIVVTALPPAYGVNDLYADEAGQLYLWLPNASYDFSAGGADYEATVSNADTTATQKSAPPAPVPVGVTVNGIELYDTGSDGEGWTYVLPTLSLTDAGPFTLAGTNTAGAVRVVVQEGVTCTVTLSNLTLVATNKNQCAFALETNAVVSLFLAGTNELASGRNRAGLEVAAGRTLAITNAPGDDAGALTATGGDESAGIGGGSGGAGGAVTISGGIVTANGSEFFGAGIGGGSGGGGGLVTISGGAVTANGGEMGAGIGSGGYAGWANGGDGGTVNITGGSVTANGGDFAAGIGGGDGDAGGTTTISGGEVSATGGKYGAGIGGGNNDGGTEENPIENASPGGTVAIFGGRVTATGGKCAPGIGGGTGQQIAGSAGAALTVSGGTLFATGGAGGAPGIGPGLGNVEEGETGDMPDASGTSTFTGGSIRIDGGYAAAAPSNNTARVWCVTVPDLTANAHIAVTSLPVTYGVNDLYADEAGQLYLWLPNAYYDFTAGGADYEATVSNADTTATPKSAPPVSTAYLTFSSADTFKVKPNAKTWNGTLEYSTNGADWNEFTTAGADAALDDGSGEYRLYLCGTNNTVIIGNKDADGWTITAAAGAVACSGDIETLLDYTTVLAGQHPAMADYCFANLFRYCTALNSAPELPATTLTTGCYYYMFGSCTGLTNAPALPATTLAEKCCQYMFSGCTGLTQPPALPATTLARSCYSLMFNACTGLTQAPDLPAATLAYGCYQFMFSGCSGLTNAPALQATTLASYCYANMFNGCTGLTRLPELPATQLANYCYQSMFNGCTGITLYEDGTDPTWGIPAGAQTATGWNNGMLAGTGGDFTGNPEIGKTYYYTPPTPPSTAYLTFSSANAFTVTPSAVSWNGALFYSTNTTDWIAFDRDGATAALDSGSGDYRLYFRGTDNTLITGGNLAYWVIDAAPATVDCSGNIETLLDYATVDGGGHPAMIANCFANLFRDCTALSSAPALPATNLADNCYVGMFRNCTGLTNTPALPATTLTGGCYQEMFRDCTSLAQAPALPATTLPPSCYKGMFTNCTALATAPELPATTLGATCYQYMFAGCTGLTNAPALQATTLAPGCYHSMFHGCTGLTQLPELPATTLAAFCYAFMFKDCTGVALHEDGAAPTWGIPNDAAEANGWNTNMLAGTGGTFTGDPEPGVTYYYTPSTPPVSTAYLTFSGTNAFTVTPLSPSWNGALECSTDAANWTVFTDAGAAAADNGAGEFRLYVRGTNNTQITDGYATSAWRINAPTGTVACSGNIETLLDYPTVDAGEHPAMANNCFARLFNGCTALSRAPELPSTNLTVECYRAMFQGCTGLTEAPELPAMILAEGCYDLMFYDCAGLLEAPELPATNLATKCYYAMFSGCTALTNAPALPAATLAKNGYSHLFNGCTSLTDAPALPATTLVPNCYQYMFAGCTALTNAPALPATMLAAWCYGSMFSGCTGLTQAPALTSTTLAQGCYGSMFYGCTGLTNAPVLSATALADWCYGSMFQGCTGLTRLPELPATTLAFGCYGSMFKDCTGVTLHEDGTGETWGIPDTQTATGWNTDMLANTGGTFTGDPAIGATYYYTPSTPPVSTAYLTFASTNAFKITPQVQYWEGVVEYSTDAAEWHELTTTGADAALGGFGDYRLYVRGTNNTCVGSSMFGWNLNATAPVVCSGNIETLLDYPTVEGGAHPAMGADCFGSLFRNWTWLVNAPALPATTLANGCYQSMFEGCTRLESAPALPAATLAKECYRDMFNGCTGLTDAPGLPAGTLADYACNSMFKGCTSLAAAPALAATNLASYCCQSMFEGCASLTNAPVLAAGTLATSCYASMFKDCTSLGEAPGLPATNLASYCCYAMFAGCTGLTNAPVLPATTLASQCYYKMFSGCTGLTETPVLAATNLSSHCYANMFEGCTALTRLPELPATTLATACYKAMFNGCTGIALYEDGTAPTWGIPADAVEATGWNTDMLAGTGGTFTGDPVIGATYYYTPSTPPVSTAYLTFASTNTFTVTPQEASWNGTLQCSTDTTNWTAFTTAGATAAANANGEYRLYLRGTGNTRITGYTKPGWNINAAAPVACSGDIETLLDYATVDNGDHPAMADYCFANLFNGCTALSSAPALPATTLATSCYASMFYGCTGLTQAPALPATTLADSCYRAMFANCTSLAEAPTLPATNLADSCCSFMFSDCTTLTTPPVLPATNLAGNCYTAMFSGCMGLTEAPTLPATTLAYGCYKEMFYGCTALTRLPELPATTLAKGCYANMFNGCTALTQLPELPATALADYCYYGMFSGCTGITLYEDGTAPTWGIPGDAVPATDWNTGMLVGTGGTFTGDPAIGVTYYYTPLGVQVVFDATGGAFADGASAVTQVCVNVYGELPVAVRDGYTLVGWFDGCTNGAAQAVTGGALIYNAAHTLHARWTAAPGTTPASIFAYTNNADGTVTITGFADPNQQVTKLVLPDMIDGRFVTAIAPSAFANSTSGMTEVYFPVFCTSIGSKAFLSVPTITRLVFPNTRDWRNPTEPAALRIGRYAFSGATGLTELTLPAEVAELGDYAFSNTRNLQRVTILGHPVLGNQVFRSAGMDTDGVTLHLDPALANDPDYMNQLTAGMKLAEVKTDAIITGLRIYMIGFAPSGNVILGVIVEKAAEWGDPDPASIWVQHRARLSDASAVLIPIAAELEEDGTVTLEVERPEGGSAFFRAFVLPPEAD